MKEKDVMESWMGTLSDEERAKVMQTQIAETEATKRAAMAEEGKSRRALIDSDGYHIVRGLGMVALVVFVLGSTCVGYRSVEAWQIAKVFHPTLSPVASASAAPSGSNTRTALRISKDTSSSPISSLRRTRRSSSA